jgi:hypothetical protein
MLNRWAKSEQITDKEFLAKKGWTTGVFKLFILLAKLCQMHFLETIIHRI